MKYFYSFDELSIPFWIKALYWGLYLGVFVYAVWKTLLSSTKHGRQKEFAGLFTALFIVFFSLYAVFYCINPDYFRYRDWMNVDSIDLWEKEDFYIYTVLFCMSLPFDYPFEVFRMIVWGGAVCIVYLTYRIHRELLLPGLALLLLFVFYAGTFCYGRASLAMAVYFLGIALYFNCKGFLWKIPCIMIAISSYFFHHEMIIGIALLPCLFIPFERKRYAFLSIFLLLIAIISLSFISSNLQFLDQMFDNDELTDKIEEFNEKGQGAFRLSTLVKYLNFFYPFYLITTCFWKRNIPHMVAVMYRITYGILMVSVAFMVVTGTRSVFSYRVMYISMIPMTLMIAFGYSHRYFTRKQFLILMILALLSNSIRFINAQ